MENIKLIIVGLLIILFIIYVICATARKKTLEKYRILKKEFPLNKGIHCHVNREIINDNFDKLTDVEICILTKRVTEIYLIREEGNLLVAILYDENNLKSRYKLKDEQTKRSLVKYINKNYFTKIKNK